GRGGGALDAERLGRWGHEGPWWLQAVVEEARTQGLALARLDDALGRREPAPAPPDLPVTSWGSPRDLATWSAPAVAELAWSARAAELRVLTAGAEAGPRARRELLALPAPHWAFIVPRGL